LPRYKLVIIAISSPLIIGVYRDGILIEEIKSDKKTSDILLKLLMELEKKYNYKELIYTNGPGSYMAIKLTYITLRTLEILKDITFVGCDAFSLNGSSPIKAMGKMGFIKEKNSIVTKKFDEPIVQQFKLPHLLNEIAILDDNKPLYILPAT
jgi:hypothetical protein